MEAALQIRLRFVVQDIDRHGKRRIYFRRKGSAKVRLRADPGSEAFLEEYRSAFAAEPQKAPVTRQVAQPGTCRWLCERYYLSAEFQQLGDRTRYVRRGLLDAFCERNNTATKRFAHLEPRHIRQLRDEKVHTPEAANGRVKALRQLYAWAKDAGIAASNPAKEVPYLSSGSDGYHTWSVEEVRGYEAAHPIGTKARLAMALLLYTGVRRSDVVRLGPRMEHDGVLCFTETKGAIAKTRKRGSGPKHRELPILPELRAILDATPPGASTYLVTEFSKPFTANGFGNRFRKWCDEAGLEHCSAHGLRKAGATIAAGNGAREFALMAIYGWESPKQAALYTKKADRRRLTFENMHLLVPSVPPLSTSKHGGTVPGKKPS
jgi:integrase